MPSAKPITVTLKRRPARYELRFVKAFKAADSRSDRAQTDNLMLMNGRKRKRPAIRVLKKYLADERQKELIELVAHEITHAGAWDLDEEVVLDIGEAVSEALHKLGYRRVAA